MIEILNKLKKIKFFPVSGIKEVKDALENISDQGVISRTLSLMAVQIV